MDIGAKIKNARIKAGLTQEQAAESLGVSRQTISNWETEKTYPDIASVVKMSDLYAVSLDSLLKEENHMDYLNYLKESADVVKSKNKFSKLILIIAYLAIWAISLVAFWFFTSGSDAMGYSIIFFYILLPVTTFVLSFLIGKNDYWGRWKWISAIIFGVMYMLTEYVTFSVANMVAFDKVNEPEWGMFIAGELISFIGLGIGALVRILLSNKEKNER